MFLAERRDHHTKSLTDLVFVGGPLLCGLLDVV